MRRPALLVVLAAVTVWQNVQAQGPNYGPNWVAKTTWLFTDCNDNRVDIVLTESDFKGLADKNIAQNGLTGNAAVKQRSLYTVVWQLLAANKLPAILPIFPPEVNIINFPEVLKKVGNYVFEDTIDNFYTPIFDICDPNDDGGISIDEFTNFFVPYLIPKEVSALGYPALDRNPKDGKISQDELLNALKLYFIRPEFQYAAVPWLPYLISLALTNST